MTRIRTGVDALVGTTKKGVRTMAENKAAGVKITSLRVRDTSYDVYVDDEGQFSAYLSADEPVRAPSLASLRARLAGAKRRKAVKYSIPFALVTNGQVRHGTVTGVHLGTGNYLVTWADGSKDQLSYSGTLRVTRPLAAAEVLEVGRRHEAVVAAQAANRALFDSVKINIAAAVKDAEKNAPDPD